MSAAAGPGHEVLAISGSLRRGSANEVLLRAAAALAPASLRFSFYDALDTLPHFNPDLDGEGAVPPAPVAELRRRVGGAAALCIASPEYAHGVPGSLKNALDWLVSAVEIVDKPIVLLNASPSGGRHAQAALVETLRTMSTRVLLDASLLEPFLPRRLVAAGDAADLDDAAASAAVARSMALLARHLRDEGVDARGPV